MHVPYVDLGQQYEDHRKEILDRIDATLKSGQYILGEEVTKFETDFAKLCNTKHAIGLANGTDTLYISLLALGVKPGDEVISPPNSWISSASCAALIGAKPVFVDVKKDQTMDPEKLEAAITKKTKVIIPVHLTGKIADMDPILKIAKKHKIAVLEDAAQSVGAKYRGKKAGSIGDMGSFSLHPLKNLNGAGDGGAIVTNSTELYEKVLLLRNHGLVNRDTISQWGYNSRLDTIQAAILNCKLPHLDEIIAKRRKNAELYRNALKDIVYCPEDEADCFDVYHLFVIQCKKRDQLKVFLGDKGIQCAVHYPIPLHLQGCSKELDYKKGDFPNVETQSNEILSLPIHQNLTTEQVQFVIDSIKEFYS